jgi:hypothetical protein
MPFGDLYAARSWRLGKSVGLVDRAARSLDPNVRDRESLQGPACFGSALNNRRFKLTPCLPPPPRLPLVRCRLHLLLAHYPTVLVSLFFFVQRCILPQRLIAPRRSPTSPPNTQTCHSNLSPSPPQKPRTRRTTRQIWLFALSARIAETPTLISWRSLEAGISCVGRVGWFSATVSLIPGVNGGCV